MYLALDLGTSSLKAIVCDESQKLLASAQERYPISSPAPGYAEQDPQQWIEATRKALSQLITQVPQLASRLRAIGLSGQMHTLVALDRQDHPIRPAILWNDVRGRDFVQAAAALPELTRLTGVGPMASFTAAKLHWLRHQEPASYQALQRVVLPKDYLRLWLTGQWASDPSDAAGSQLFDQERLQWCEPVLDLLGIDPKVMPPLLDSAVAAGNLRPQLADELGLPAVPVICGGGDAATGALGTGCIDESRSMISLGTGALYLVADRVYRPAADPSIHTFAHCLPSRWYRMGTLLASGSALEWVCRVTGFPSVAEAIGQLEARGWSGPGPVTVLPHLDGRRAPYPAAEQRGAITGLDRATSGLDLVQAMLEGICFALAEADNTLAAAGPLPESPLLIGGGGRSAVWSKMLATILDRPVEVVTESGAGSALGAIRLAMLGTGVALSEVALPPETRRVEPDRAVRGAVVERFERWRSLQGLL